MEHLKIAVEELAIKRIAKMEAQKQGQKEWQINKARQEELYDRIKAVLVQHENADELREFVELQIEQHCEMCTDSYLLGLADAMQLSAILGTSTHDGENGGAV